MKTAVEWQFEQLFNSFEKFNNGEYTFNDYLKRNLEIREQAKEMEKEKHLNWNKFLESEKTLGISDVKTIERVQWYYNEYYKETFKSE
jgi:hypothetical protein